jgi:chromodomain-helicase-DNA-binding protein 4
LNLLDDTSVDQKRANGEIGDFDPSSTIVHSDSRVRLKIRLGMNQRAVSSDYTKTPASDSDSGTSDEDEDEDMLQDKDEEMETPEGSEDSEGESSTAPARASGRLAVKSTTELPFSPRKTRAKKKFFTHDDDGSAHSMDEQPRRSSRARKSTRRDDDDDVAFIDDDDGNDSQDSDIVEVRRPKKPKRVSILPLPVVGEVHSVDERVDDPNPSTAACRNHREACEKCGLGPSHTMKKKARRRKLDEFEEDNDSLGGWLRW